MGLLGTEFLTADFLVEVGLISSKVTVFSTSIEEDSSLVGAFSVIIASSDLLSKIGADSLTKLFVNSAIVSSALNSASGRLVGRASVSIGALDDSIEAEISFAASLGIDVSVTGTKISLLSSTGMLVSII